MKRISAVLSIVLSLLFGGVTAAYSTPMSVAASNPTREQPYGGASGVEIEGLDLHDGTIIKADGIYHFYGTMYGCGFYWKQNTPWCGFGVSTAPTLEGPWTKPQILFSPSDISPFAKKTWQELCGSTGSGCFNPRMIQRTWGPRDGVWILWFNAPNDYSRTRANAYYAMGCNSATGPCGKGAGAPYGSTIKPSLWHCTGNGDMSLVQSSPTEAPWLFCTNANQTISQERLNAWGTGGTKGAGNQVAGISTAESPGAYQAHDGTWILTYSDTNCGYCSGTGTSYMTAVSLAGPWTSPSNAGWSAPSAGRRSLSGTSCGGQPRTVTVLDGQAYQMVDLWYGGGNQANASTMALPLVYRGQVPEPGRPWQPFNPWLC
jgi:hypothetical protein